MLRNSTKSTKAIFPYLDFLCGVFSLFGLVWHCHGNMAKRSQMIQLNSTEVFFPYVCVLLSSLFIYQYLSDIATRIPLSYNSEYKNKILVSKETEMLRRCEWEKIGFIKRVRKGRITTVKDLEGWPFRALALRQSKNRNCGLLLFFSPNSLGGRANSRNVSFRNLSRL